ncbi:MAG: hypothetical protein Fur0046_24810 [Cyanobacteria bacterium J069]|nr:MAG: hypothetical protein D6742_13675 [Cyanobacteria bacterium J069]
MGQALVSVAAPTSADKDYATRFSGNSKLHENSYGAIYYTIERAIAKTRSQNFPSESIRDKQWA